jgi:hypothetical protein
MEDIFMLFDNIDFSKTLFYPAAGTDIQVILRFSHLTDTIISATVSEYLTLERYEVLFRTKCDTLNNHFNCNMLEYCGVEELDNSFIKNNLRIAAPSGVFNRYDMDDYQRVFGEFARQEPHLYKFTFKRYIGQEVRNITWYAFTTEGLATLVSLHNLTGKFPMIICSIQSGRIEEPNGIFCRMVNSLQIDSKIWVRGQWAESPSGRQHLEARALEEFPPYDIPVQSFGQWNSKLGVDAISCEDNYYYDLSLVRAFAKEQEYVASIPKDVILTHPNNPNRKIHILLGDIKEDTRSYDQIYTSNRILPSGNNIINWEDIGAGASLFFPSFTMERSLEYIRDNTEDFRNKKVAITGVGYEDEGCFIKQFLNESEEDMNLTIFHNQPLDFVDLK